MTFEQLKAVVKDYCNLSSPDADTRVGKSINRHYRRVTALCGLDTPFRTVTRTVSTTTTVRTVQFTEIEKIDRIIDATTAASIRPLEQVSLDEIQLTQSVDAAPSKWAYHSTTSDDVTILMDTAPTAVYSLQATGTVTLSDLSGSDEPAFPESFHDILSWYVVAEEMVRKEKPQLAAYYEQKSRELLGELKMLLADSPSYSTKQASRA